MKSFFCFCQKLDPAINSSSQNTNNSHDELRPNLHGLVISKNDNKLSTPDIQSSIQFTPLLYLMHHYSSVGLCCNCWTIGGDTFYLGASTMAAACENDHESSNNNESNHLLVQSDNTFSSSFVFAVVSTEQCCKN
jgi:hypothetical protein